MQEDLTLFLQDFGQSCTAGGVTALGILDMPSQIVSGDMVLSTDYALTCRTADFGGLVYGDPITVGGVAYQVREVRRLDDGLFCEVALTRLSPNQIAPGGQPREFGMADLADVSLRNPQAGDRLVYDGTRWVDMEEGDGTNVVDGGTAS